MPKHDMNIYGLIGYPLTHSFSKKYFEEKFAIEHIEDVSFELFPLKDISEFDQLLKNQSNIKGVSVTIPFKQSVVPFLQELDHVANSIGAVNCIKIKDGLLKGFNTDAIGFEKSLSPLLKSFHQSALVLGTGGASLAVRYVLEKLNIDYRVCSRSKERSKDGLIYEDISSAMLNEFKIIINCTPVGMAPHESECIDIPYDAISHQHLLFDLIYNPPETLFLRKGREMGAAVKNGHEMFQIQAEENWEIWNS
jgi:shikimate dehydrogenase